MSRSILFSIIGKFQYPLYWWHFVVILFIFYSNNDLSAQTYYFDTYSVKEGLAQSKVYSIVQDSDGYIWLGTKSGVSKFDGNTFINYTSDNGLAESGVQIIIEDSYKNIWFGHLGGGLTRFNGKKFEIFNSDTLKIKSDITDIEQDKKGRIWVSTDGDGVFLIRNPHAAPNDINYRWVKGQEGLSDRVFRLTISHDGTIYFTTDVGIKFYEEIPNKFSFFRLEGIPRYFLPTYMFESSNGDLWFGTHNGGLYHYNIKQQNFKIYDTRDGLAHNFISCIAEDKNKDIWIGTWGGGITKISDKQLKTFNNQNGFPDHEVRTIIEDREGNILIGTNQNGLTIYKGEQFISFNQSNGLIGNQVFNIYEDDKNRMWFGTDEGITIYTPPPDEATFTTIDNDLMINDQIEFITQDLNKHIWFFSKTNGISRYNYIAKETDYDGMLNQIIAQKHGVVTSMVVDKFNNIWIGTIDGLIYHEIDNKKYALLTQRSGLSGNDISALYCDSKGIMWVGANGAGVTNINDTIFTIVDIDKKITPTSFIEDSKGRIWIGTESQGVLVCEKNKIVKQFRMQEGLLSDYITLLEVDNAANIYIGTNMGLNKYSVIDDKFYTYTQKNGFTGIEVKNNASYKDHNGDLWFGTVNGVIKLNVENLKMNQLEPLTHINRLRVNLKEREMTDGLKLNHQENSVVFDYSSICLTNPKAVKYKVMLEGADDEWSPETRQTTANYPILAPNKYTFMVIACNDVGVWNQQPVSFSFVIKPPFWQTWWFILSCVVAGAVIIFVYIKMRERKLIVEKEILEAKVVERTAEIVQKNKELAAKNKSIMDSIRYAKRIQDALLPDNAHIQSFIKDYFILYKPRDIVSGDFYWTMQKESKIYFVAADCTGHGVPGGFMSMLGIAFLNEIVNKELETAAEILNQLREYVIRSLKQTGKKGDTHDGMDLALCVFDYNKKSMQFASANNPGYLIRNNALHEISAKPENAIIQLKPDKMPIGIYYRKTKTFTNQEFNLSPGDVIYLSSDGYKDQFGGTNQRKFMSKNFKKLLVDIHKKPMEKQQEILDLTFENWRGELEQVDDVLVAGIRF